MKRTISVIVNCFFFLIEKGYAMGVSRSLLSHEEADQEIEGSQGMYDL